MPTPDSATLDAAPAAPGAAATTFHAGEQALQRRAGSWAQLAEFGPRVVRAAMPEQHRAFFEQLPFVALGLADEAGQPWATLLAGPGPGFVHSPDATHLHLAALPAADEPVAAALRPGAAVGLLGIELPTRRRNRANGSVEALDEAGWTMAVTQSFGNCPKYIQRRQVVAGEPRTEPPPAARRSDRLNAAQAALVENSDTFFIATQAPPGTPGGGSDVSHRGGRPGFVRVADEGRTLAWPDFTGNRFFNTLGNLLLEPRAGLVFVDFESGDLLHLAGRAEIAWSGPAVDRYVGAERLLRFEVDAVVHRPAAWPLRWRFVEASPALEHTGVW